MYGLLLLILSIAKRSFGLNITVSVPGYVRIGETISVVLTYSDGDPANFYLSMYCTNEGQTDDSVSNVANFTSDTTEDISVVSFGNCIIHALLRSDSESQADTLVTESEPFDLLGNNSDSQPSSTSTPADRVMLMVQMVNLALGATSFLGVLGIILYLFLQRTRVPRRNRLSRKPLSIADPESPAIILPSDQHLALVSPKSLEPARGVGNFSFVSRGTPDVPAAVQSVRTSDPSLYSATTSENVTFLSFPLPPTIRQSELQQFAAHLRREVSLRSAKISLEEGQGAGEERLRKQIAGMRSEIAYLTAELDLTWALGFGQITPSSGRRSAESGTVSVYSRAPQVSNVIS
ncbi:uncharacterized protein BT62DRAFT_1012893 [Guyanagaster necrorhizus]|uniref:Uncharacterized protein n=1 Tax=Guyanagaster necrorhizus TaxID=856835 RepID=A0A9P8AM28_9AGAR|nr:uncharacterized protein BT62DRAFT_1012893 [Guyanagaster necrorhizus MCA 3950]KAG7440241.1 hypothetical protein BT62DRAFT_1012893 [Guyanagaster necrorhizus MCA 3950]